MLELTVIGFYRVVLVLLDVELQNEAGRQLARARLPEGVAGMARLHAMIGERLGEDDEATVMVAIETEREPWVQALRAAGYRLYAINPLQVARFRERYRVSGAKSDTGDAHVLADMVRTDWHQLRPVAGDSVRAEAVKVVTRAHKTLVWERSRHTLLRWHRRLIARHLTYPHAAADGHRLLRGGPPQLGGGRS